MVVQFSCPGCQQPIEVDDDWASQNVACPFCQRVVTAPTESTLKSIETAIPPTARRLSPSGPGGVIATDAAATPRYNRLAAVGFGLSLSALFLYVLSNILLQFLIDHLGPNPQFDEETQKKVMQLMSDPQYGGRFLGGLATFCLGALCWLAGLIICAIAVRRKGVPGHRLALVGIGCSMLLPAFVCSGFLFR